MGRFVCRAALVVLTVAALATLFPTAHAQDNGSRLAMNWSIADGSEIAPLPVGETIVPTMVIENRLGEAMTNVTMTATVRGGPLDLEFGKTKVGTPDTITYAHWDRVVPGVTPGTATRITLREPGQFTVTFVATWVTESGIWGMDTSTFEGHSAEPKSIPAPALSMTIAAFAVAGTLRRVLK